ncbi:YcnI family protein [Gordonia soli]|uniref:YncI copper-binding domain-containing protein n=1 Tax=Gordonia soli NBRC 108243 TaxID=1223545 RepID=M0QEH8_9ACTN|nr:YcnI family protein [Gordonia soli]GAC66731.1 hypothetical protein GS4_03_01790 [Gordonia soli NBRC 108243]
MLTNRSRRTATVLAIAVLSAPLAPAAVAAAHVTATADVTTRGKVAQVTLRVPTESDTASTTALSVRLPADHPLAFVAPEPTPGWRIEVTKGKPVAPVHGNHGATVDEAVTAIRWVATAGGIPPGQFGRFTFLAGPLPEADSLSLPTVQTYSDGKDVDWVQVASGGAEPEYPAPTLELTAADTTDTGAADVDGGSDTLAVTAVVLSAVAVVIALAAAVVPRLLGRRGNTPTP